MLIASVKINKYRLFEKKTKFHNGNTVTYLLTWLYLSVQIMLSFQIPLLKANFIESEIYINLFYILMLESSDNQFR